MKRLIFSLSFIMMAAMVMAVPAKRGMWTTLKLADGTEVRAEKVGDEHGHWLRAEDGTCYVMGADGYVKADAQALQARRQARMAARNVPRRAIYASTSDGLGKKGTMSRGAVPSIGEYVIPVVMVQFSDTKFKSTTTVAKMTRYYNEEGYSDESGAVGSVRDYFKAQSGGQFVPTFDVVGIVTLKKSAATYGTNDANGYDQGLDDLPGDVISAAVSQLGTDFSKYVVPAGDSYHKKGVPLLAMFYAGKGEATEAETTANKKLLWPCEWDAEEDPVGQGTYNGVHFNSFFIGNELMGSKLMGPSVFCHEFGHALGLPDFYCTDGSYSGDDAFGLWSIMDSGAYVDDECRTPIGYNAYEKSYMGWLELQELGDAGEVTLQSPLGLAEGSAYIVRNGNTETFILENRQPGTWYPSTFGAGVLVSRIAYSYNYWSQNEVNNTQSKKRACVLTADGSQLYYSAKKSNLYGSTKKSIETLKTLSGSTKEIGVKNITLNSNGTIKLTLKEGTPDDGGDTPVSDALFYEAFKACEGTGGNDNTWSGAIASADFASDNEGWVCVKGYSADGCAKIGTANLAGSATTPPIALNGEGTLTFKAAAWDTTKESTTLKLSATGGSVSPTQVTLERGQWTEYTATIRGTGNVKITFASGASKTSRFFLDEVMVSTTATGIETVPTAKQQGTGIVYDLSGRRVANPRRGIYIVDGKKVVK